MIDWIFVYKVGALAVVAAFLVFVYLTRCPKGCDWMTWDEVREQYPADEWVSYPCNDQRRAARMAYEYQQQIGHAVQWHFRHVSPMRYGTLFLRKEPHE